MIQSEESSTIITNKVRESFALFPYIGRSLVLVFKATKKLAFYWIFTLSLTALIPVGFVWLSKPFVDELTLLINGSTSYITLILYISIFVGLSLVYEGLQGVLRYIEETQGELVHDYVTTRIHESSKEAPLITYDLPEYHDKLFRVQEESSDRPLATVEALGGILQSTLTLLSITLLLLPYGWWLPIILLGSSIPALFVIFTYKLRFHKWRLQNTSRKRKAWYFDSLLTQRQSAAELRFFDLGYYFQNQYRLVRELLRTEYLSLLKEETVVKLLAVFTGLLLSGLALCWMIWQTITGIISIGALVLIYQAFNQGGRVSNSLFQNIGELYSNALYLVDLFNFIDSQHSSDLLIRESSNSAIEVKNLSFSYPGAERKILDNLSFSISDGELVVIIGENGSGKSTLVKLLAGLYKCDSGEIALKGRSSLMFQEPVRYNDTVKRSITYGDIHSDDISHFQESLHQAELQKYIDFSETLLGTTFHGGTELSVGEWQRIALARTLYRKANILILDEPTSSMDIWSEKRWLERIQALKREKTILIITHRIGVTDIADRVLTLRDGVLLEISKNEILPEVDTHYA